MLGKPGLWPALVLNTVLRKPGGQLPLAGVIEPEVRDVPEVPELPALLEDPVLGPALLAPALEDGETKFNPALAWRAAFDSVKDEFLELNLHGDALLPAARRDTR